jgi:branched-subunit amino acid ABC-type transport system permease component
MISQLLINSIVSGSIYALSALSFTLIYRTVRFFNFAHGAIYTICAYAAYTFQNILGFNSLISFFLH